MKKYDSEIAVRDDISCVLNGQIQKIIQIVPLSLFFFSLQMKLLDKIKARWALRNAGSRPMDPEKRVKILKLLQKWVPIVR